MKSLVIIVLRLYKGLISPLLPACCIYRPTCSEYARQAIASRGLLTGTALACARILRCHPWGQGGYDPPPSRKRS